MTTKRFKVKFPDGSLYRFRTNDTKTFKEDAWQWCQSRARELLGKLDIGDYGVEISAIGVVAYDENAFKHTLRLLEKNLAVVSSSIIRLRVVGSSNIHGNNINDVNNMPAIGSKDAPEAFGNDKELHVDKTKTTDSTGWQLTRSEDIGSVNPVFPVAARFLMVRDAHPDDFMI